MDTDKKGPSKPDSLDKPQAATTNPLKSPTSNPKSDEPQRKYAGEGEIKSDLFVLLPAQMLKDRTIDPKAKQRVYEPLQHQHMYRNFDSSGRRIDSCSPVGGHYHRCEVVVENGQLKLKVSPALKRVQTKDGEIKEVELEHDQHTHAAEYRETSLVKRRTMSEEAAKAISLISRRQNPTTPAGAKEGSV